MQCIWGGTRQPCPRSMLRHLEMVFPAAQLKSNVVLDCEMSCRTRQSFHINNSWLLWCSNQMFEQNWKVWECKCYSRKKWHDQTSMCTCKESVIRDWFFTILKKIELIVGMPMLHYFTDTASTRSLTRSSLDNVHMHIYIYILTRIMSKSDQTHHFLGWRLVWNHIQSFCK